MSCYFDGRIWVSLQIAGHDPKIPTQITTHCSAVEGKENILRHGDNQLRACVCDAHLIIVEIPTQVGGLLIKILAYDVPSARAHNGPDHSALAAVPATRHLHASNGAKNAPHDGACRGVITRFAVGGALGRHATGQQKQC